MSPSAVPLLSKPIVRIEQELDAPRSSCNITLFFGVSSYLAIVYSAKVKREATASLQRCFSDPLLLLSLSLINLSDKLHVIHLEREDSVCTREATLAWR